MRSEVRLRVWAGGVHPEEVGGRARLRQRVIKLINRVKLAPLCRVRQVVVCLLDLQQFHASIGSSCASLDLQHLNGDGAGASAGMSMIADLNEVLVDLGLLSLVGDARTSLVGMVLQRNLAIGCMYRKCSTGQVTWMSEHLAQVPPERMPA